MLPLPRAPRLSLIPRPPNFCTKSWWIIARSVTWTLCLAVVAITTVRSTAANCRGFGGFPVFQCADLAYFNPPPDFDPNKYFLDPDDPAVGVQNVKVVYWQIGFGNNNLNTGFGSLGTGNSGATTFNGNDQGVSGVDLKEARSATGTSSIPLGGLCLGSNNWGNSGVDGCCDNDRDPTHPLNKDGVPSVIG